MDQDLNKGARIARPYEVARELYRMVSGCVSLTLYGRAMRARKENYEKI